MASPRASRLLAVAGGVLPWAVQVLAAIGLVAWLGGVDGLSNTLAMAGRPVHQLNALILLSTLALSVLLYFVASGRRLSWAVPVVAAMVPWLAGTRAALKSTQETFAAVATGSAEFKLTLLMQGTGELLSTPVLGSWFSASLLLATALALLLSSQARRLEAGLVVLLAAGCLLTAVETRSLSLLLTQFASVAPADQGVIVAQALQELGAVPPLCAGALGAASLLVLVLGVRALRRQPRDTSALSSLAVVVLVTLGALWAHRQPQLRMRAAVVTQAAESAASPTP